MNIFRMFITFVLIRTNKRNRFGHSDSSVLEESRYFNWSYQVFIYQYQIFQIFSHKCVLFSLEMHYRPFSKLQLIFYWNCHCHYIFRFLFSCYFFWRARPATRRCQPCSPAGSSTRANTSTQTRTRHTGWGRATQRSTDPSEMIFWPMWVDDI